MIDRARQQIEAVSPRRSDQDTISSGGQSASRTVVDILPPDSIPGYEIQREIHRGGQGVVYLALQRSTKRRVAIKVMKEGPFAGTADRTRFEREVQILGQLQHRNIVTIHESGAASGSFYFVMDYISGKALDHHLVPGKSPLKETLQLVAKIADAVNAAHLRGVIHRDLKPSNVRIDGDGEPHILDFGLAKVATEVGSDLESPAMMTMTGQFVGSLPWASPEQAAGDSAKMDIRTDVYSLGVILYQMLTGRFPYGVAGHMRDVLDNIQRAEPNRPSAVRRDIDDEVETIVIKCLHKDRERRYQTAGELARDIRHYLAGEPIEAKRDSSWYVVKKTLRRYRVPVVVALAFVLMAVVLGAISSVYYVRAVREARKADRFSAFLEKTLGYANPYREKGKGEATVREALDGVSRMIERELAGEPDVEARIRSTIGNTYAGLGLFDQAEPHLRAALDIRRRIRPAMHAEVAASLNDLGVMYRERKDYASAEPLLREAVEMRRKIDAESADYAISLNNLARLQKLTDRLSEAEMNYREALAISRQAVGPDSAQVLTILNNLAVLTRDRGDYAAAEPIFRDVLALRRKLLGSDHPDVPGSLHNLSSLVEKRCDFTEAEALDREALATRRAILGDDHYKTADSLFALSITLNKQGKYAEAEANIRECLSIRRKHLGDEATEVAAAMIFHAVLLKNLGRYAEAEPIGREALRIRRERSGPRHTQTAECMHNLANVLFEAGKFDEAEQQFRESLAIYREALGGKHPAVAATLEGLAALLVIRGEYAEAESMLQEGLTVYEGIGVHAAMEIPLAKAALGRLYLERGDAGQAEGPLRDALSRVRTRCPEDRIRLAVMTEDLGRSMVLAGRFAEAEPLLRDALATRQAVLGDNHPHTAKALQALGELAAAKGDDAAARPLYEQALAIRLAAIPQHPDTAATLTALADLLLRKGDASTAEPLAREALSTRRRYFRESDWRVAESLSVVGGCLKALGRREEAQAMLSRAYESLKEARGAASPVTVHAKRRLSSEGQRLEAGSP